MQVTVTLAMTGSLEMPRTNNNIPINVLVPSSIDRDPITAQRDRFKSLPLPGI